MSPEFVSNLIAIGALIFSVGSAIWLRRTVELDDRWSRTLSIHEEYNSLVMGAARSSAIKFVRFHKEVDWKSIDNLSELNGSGENIQALYEIMRFYHRMFVLVRANRLVKSELFSLFGPEFAWWYGYIFKRMAIV